MIRGGGDPETSPRKSLLTCLLGLGAQSASQSQTGAMSDVSHKPEGKLYFESLILTCKSLYSQALLIFLVIKYERDLCLVLCVSPEKLSKNKTTLSQI